MAGFSRRAVLAGGGALLAAPLTRAWGQEARFFRIATGPTESGYFEVGTLLGNIVSSPPGARDCERGGSCGVPGLIAVTQTTAGAIANVELIRAQRIESSLCQADIAYWAYHGTGLYRKQGAARDLRAIANLYPESLHVVTRRAAGIREFRQLRGKTVSLGDKDSSTLVTARTVLQAAGLQERDLKARFLKPAEAADAMRDGRIDAFFDMSGTPSSVIADLARDAPIDLLPIDGAFARRLKASYPFLAETHVPATAYTGIVETSTVSVGVLWVVHAGVDEATVYGLTRALWHPNNRRALDSGHPYGKLIRRNAATEGVALQLHPGAALYYFEAGLIK
ncbi:MAG: TAXI family TRAP transporter solute-binding subunit [Alphaproteobacteria bacterium]|nr:TAXI family TRAP transporter solute-binding subunit [Alphaproteobacteria bacterium]